MAPDSDALQSTAPMGLLLGLAAPPKNPEVQMTNDKPEPPRLVTLPEAQRLIGIKMTKLNQLCREGHLEKVHVGKRALISMTSIERFIASLK